MNSNTVHHTRQVFQSGVVELSCSQHPCFSWAHTHMHPQHSPSICCVHVHLTRPQIERRKISYKLHNHYVAPNGWRCVCILRRRQSLKWCVQSKRTPSRRFRMHTHTRQPVDWGIPESGDDDCAKCTQYRMFGKQDIV